MKHMLAGLVLASSLVACSDRAPQVIAVPQSPLASPEQPAVMTVSGSAVLDVSPDCADMTMTLTTDGARPGIAATALGKQQRAMIAALKELGVATSDMKISHVRLDPIHRQWPHELKVATYRAAVTITVTTKKFDQIAAMMETAANAGASSLSTQFRRSNLPELKKQVREMALRAAKEKAELTAKTLGITLGRVTSVAEAPAGHMWRAYYFPNNIGNVAASAPSDSTETTLGGDTQKLSLEITIGFELAKRA